MNILLYTVKSEYHYFYLAQKLLKTNLQPAMSRKDRRPGLQQVLSRKVQKRPKLVFDLSATRRRRAQNQTGM